MLISLWEDPTTYAVPFFALFMLIEVFTLRGRAASSTDAFPASTTAVPPTPVAESRPPARTTASARPPARGYERRDTLINLAMGLGSVIVNVAARAAALWVYVAAFQWTPLRLPADHWGTWLFTFLAIDLLWYLYHRSAHRVRLLWAAHQAHHSSQYFNFAVALRQKWNPWGELLFWLPLPLLGVPPGMIFFVFSINLIYQFFVHTEAVEKLPSPIEWLFNTPSHHRVHHASDPEYLDKNYAGILIVWDRLFGTFAAETHRPTYGLTKPVTTSNVFALQYGEFGQAWRDVKQAATWRERLNYLIKPPGWSPALIGAASNHPPTPPSEPSSAPVPRR